jgi:hypothetical protein
MKTKHPSTARLICILQLSHTIFSRAAQDPSGEITVRFSPPKSTQTDPHGNLRFVFNENDQVKCKAENGQTHMHAKLQEHVQKEIGKMLASGQMPEKFKLDLPPGELCLILQRYLLMWLHFLMLLLLLLSCLLAQKCMAHWVTLN